MMPAPAPSGLAVMAPSTHLDTATLRKQLARGLVHLLVQRILYDRDVTMAAAYLEDMGYDDCPVCMANRQRESWS
jgi:hypothetical protein